MTATHPITPPPELERQWSTKYIETSMSFTDLVAEVARWGADQELDACCEEVLWLGGSTLAAKLRARRRPKPPTDKELALRELGDAYDKGKIDDTTYDTIRRALEALPND
jgi:hypothetical protein